jgi:hypothetical protein
MAAIDEVTLLVWAELPEKVFSCIDHAVASGQSAGVTIGQTLNLTPNEWDESVKSTIVFGAVIDNLRAADRGGGEAENGDDDEDGEGYKDEEDGRDHEGEEGEGYEDNNYDEEMEERGVHEEEEEDDDVEEVHGKVSHAEVDATSDHDPRWERFSSSLKEWCNSHGHRSLHSAKTAWLKDGHMGQCFFDRSALGKIMGGCMEQERCRFASSHG